MIIMHQKKDIWNHITRSLKSKLTISEYNTWFAHTTLEKIDNGVAVISVPNKFVATWLHDKYLIEIKKIFKRILAKEMEQGIFHKANVKVLIYAVLEMCNWVTQWYKEDGKLSAEEIAEFFSEAAEYVVRP